MRVEREQGGFLLGNLLLVYSVDFLEELGRLRSIPDVADVLFGSSSDGN